MIFLSNFFISLSVLCAVLLSVSITSADNTQELAVAPEVNVNTQQEEHSPIYPKIEDISKGITHPDTIDARISENQGEIQIKPIDKNADIQNSESGANLQSIANRAQHAEDKVKALLKNLDEEIAAQEQQILEAKAKSNNNDDVAHETNTIDNQDSVADSNNDIADADTVKDSTELAHDDITDETNTIDNQDSVADTNSADQKETPVTKITSSQNENKKVKIKTTNKVLSSDGMSASGLDINMKTVSNVMHNNALNTKESPYHDIIPKAKPIQNPYLISGAEFFNNADYTNKNQHIIVPAFVEEYYQLLFATILTENIEGVRAITSKIGANYNIFIDNLSPLTYAISNNTNPYILRQMLSLGYMPDSIDLNNKSPLFYAVELQKYDFAIELLLWGADPNFSAKEQITPYDLAMHNDDTIMLDILQRAEN